MSTLRRVLLALLLLWVSGLLTTATAYAHPRPDTFCPLFIVHVNIWTDKPSYTINERIYLYWSPRLVGAYTATIIVSGPSGQYLYGFGLYTIGYSTISQGYLYLGSANSKLDYGHWRVGLTGYSDQGCPNWQGSTSYWVGGVNP